MQHCLLKDIRNNELLVASEAFCSTKAKGSLHNSQNFTPFRANIELIFKGKIHPNSQLEKSASQETIFSIFLSMKATLVSTGTTKEKPLIYLVTV